MKLVNIFILSVICVISYPAVAWPYDYADQEEVYISKSDLMQSADGRLFVDLGDTIIPVAELYSDDGDELFIVLTRSKSPLDQYAIRCSCCERCQTVELVNVNHGKCSNCGEKIGACKDR